MKNIRFLFLILVMMFSICSIVFAQAQPQAENDAEDDGEQITLTTYYPAPYGDYRSISAETIRLVPRPTPPENPVEGMIYYNDGTGSTEAGAYIYKTGNWKGLQTVLPGPQFIGKCVLGEAQLVIYYTSTNWWNNPYASTLDQGWILYNWDFAEGGRPYDALSIDLTGDQRIRLDLKVADDVTPGVYMITWGGGTFDFRLGTKVEFKLYYQRSGMENYGILDSFTLENPNASDNKPDNYGEENDENPVVIPMRSASYFLAGSKWVMNLKVKIIPVVSSIVDDPNDPDDEIGGDRSDPNWENWTFPTTPEYFKYHDWGATHHSQSGYKVEYDKWKKVNDRGAGVVSDLTVTIEKVQ